MPIYPLQGSLPLEHGSLPPNPYAEPTLSFGRGGLGGSGSNSLPIMVGGSGSSSQPLIGGGSGSGYEPTMTISTKAAFEAINQMFKVRRGNGGRALCGYGVALLACWCSSTGGSWIRLAGRQRAPYPQAHLAPSCPTRLQGSLPGEHGGALPPTARGPACADPTVTISTRAAFEAINAMFGGGQAAAASQPAAQQHGGSDADGFRVPAPRPPRARPAAPAAPAASPGDFCIREDTQFVSVPLEPAADSPAGSGGVFCIREDTQFITVPAGGVDDEEDEEAAMAAVASGHAAPAAAPSPGGFCIREDTQFITVAVGADEEEEEEQQQLEAAGATAQPTVALAAAPAPLFGGFSIREDTQFIGLGGDASPSPSPEPVVAALGGSGGSGRLLPQKRPLGARDGSTGDLLGDCGSSSPLDDASPMGIGAVQVR